MYGLGDITYSPEAESAAFKKLHNLTVAIGQLKQQGVSYASLMPYYQAALTQYRAMGNADPANLTSFEKFYLDAGEGLKKVGNFADIIGNKLLLGGGLVVLGLYFWKKR